MRILKRIPKEGLLKLKPESLDDLWYLKSVIAPGDLLSGVGQRRIRDEEKTRPDKGVRVPVRLGIRVEGVEFASYLNRLRVTGKIEKGPEDLISLGSYHTLEVKPGDEISLTKERWRRWELERVKEAEEAAKTPLVLILALEDGEAEFALVRRYGIDFPIRISHSISGKREARDHDRDLREFYGEAAAKLREIVEREGVQTVVLCGPGFTKENLSQFLRERNPKLAERCTVVGTGCGGKAGVHEVIKRGVIERLTTESRVSLEMGLIERLFREIGKDSHLAAYGPAEVERTLGMGAVETLLLTDRFLRKDPTSDRFIEKAKRTQGRVVIVSTDHEGGERLEAIGGIAALLRFRLP
jgi:protein pelota